MPYQPPQPPRLTRQQELERMLELREIEMRKYEEEQRELHNRIDARKKGTDLRATIEAVQEVLSERDDPAADGGQNPGLVRSPQAIPSQPAPAAQRAPAATVPEVPRGGVPATSVPGGAGSSNAPGAAQPTGRSRSSTLPSWTYFVPPQARPSFISMADIPGLVLNLFSPGADIADAVESSGKTSEAFKRGDVLGTGSNLVQTAAALVPLVGSTKRVGSKAIKGVLKGVHDSSAVKPSGELTGAATPAVRPADSRIAVAESPTIVSADRLAEMAADVESMRKAGKAAVPPIGVADTPTAVSAETLAEVAQEVKTMWKANKAPAVHLGRYVPPASRLFDHSKSELVPDYAFFEWLNGKKIGIDISPEVMRAAEELTHRIEPLIKPGIEMGGLAHHNLGALRQKFIEEYGRNLGPDMFGRLTHFMAVSSPAVPNAQQIRNGSNFFMLERQGRLGHGKEFDPRGEMRPEPYYTQWNQRVPNALIRHADEYGELDPVKHAKTSRYYANMIGNHLPVTIDRHMMRTFGLTPENGFDRKFLKPDEYRLLEYFFAREAHARGMTPAQLQGVVWSGNAAVTGVADARPWLVVFEDRIGRTARERDKEAGQVLDELVRGQFPLRSLVGLTAGGGALGYSGFASDEDAY